MDVLRHRRIRRQEILPDDDDESEPLNDEENDDDDEPSITTTSPMGLPSISIDKSHGKANTIGQEVLKKFQVSMQNKSLLKEKIRITQIA